MIFLRFFRCDSVWLGKLPGFFSPGLATAPTSQIPSPNAVFPTPGDPDREVGRFQKGLKQDDKMEVRRI